MPGRIVEVSKDVTGSLPAGFPANPEQHRREKATSNICTAHVLLAIMASMYAVYHGPEGLRRIAERVHGLAVVLAAGLRQLGFDVAAEEFFDTIRVRLTKMQSDPILIRANEAGINLRRHEDLSVGIALDELSTEDEIRRLMEIFVGHDRLPFQVRDLGGITTNSRRIARTSTYRTEYSIAIMEHEMLCMYPANRGEGSVARPFDDPVGILHHEAERDLRDAAGHLAGVLTASSLCADRAN
jgi:glycine dehydrogenase